MKKFEYQLLLIDGFNNLISDLNREGKQGWEVVRIKENQQNVGGLQEESIFLSYEVLMKREAM